MKSKLHILLCLGLIAGTASAQIFWNPPSGSTSYSPGGNGDWNTTAGNTVWWNGTTNVVFAASLGGNRVFEGGGTVSVGGNPLTYDSSTANTLLFQNLTGNYTFSGGRLNSTINASRTILNIEASAGAHNITFNNIFSVQRTADATFTHNGAGLLTFNELNINSNSPRFIFEGSGSTLIENFTGNANASTLTMNGTGTLRFNAYGNAGRIATNTATLNSGTLHLAGANPRVGFSTDSAATAKDFVWNGGVLRMDLGTTGFLDIDRNLVGTGSRVFDFNGTGVLDETYTLLQWGGTSSFSASDFSATGLASGLAGTFAIVGDELQLTVIPEPGTLLLVGIALGSLALFRRRR